MDLTPSQEQVALQATVRDLCGALLPPGRLHELADDGGWDDSLWSALAEIGVFDLRGGDEALGLADAVLVFEELGRALVPGPLVATHLARTHLASDPAGSGAVVTEAVAVGPLPVVGHLRVAERVVVVGPEGVSSHLARDVSSRHAGRPLDPLTPLWVLDDALPAGVSTSCAVQTWIAEATVLSSALQVGLARGVLDITVEHARTRQQFGRPIGSRQAVKHPLADMLRRVLIARGAVLTAAVHHDDGDVVPRATSAAKVLADRAAVGNSRVAVQLHGAMGFAWESPVHLYLKRAWLLSRLYGTAEEHENRLAEHVAGVDVEQLRVLD